MDEWGRITGEARKFRLLVCPGLDVTVREVDEALTLIATAGLWERYEAEGNLCIAINPDKWFKHQSYINKAKRDDDSGSDFPSPDKRRKTPQNTEERRETPKNTEEHQEWAQIAEIQQGTAQIAASFSSSLSSSFSASPYKTSSSSSGRGDDPFVIFQSQGFGKLDEMTTQFILDDIKTYSEPWVMHAMVEAVRQQVVKWAYVGKILKRWKETGHDEPWTLEKPETPKLVEPIQRSSQWRSRNGSQKPKIEIVQNQPQAPLSQKEEEEIRALARKLDGAS
jgi:DnaD/phage-associated family protein